MNYRRRLEEVTARRPDRIAFSTRTPAGYVDLTYGEALRRIRELAGALIAMGLERGMRAAVLSENRPEWVLAYLAIHFAGGVVVPLDAQISPAEWVNLLKDSGSRFVFVSGSLYPRLSPALADADLPLQLISMDPPPDGKDIVSSLANLEAQQVTAAAPALPEIPLEELMVIIYTSGTTGRPKGVMLTQHNIVSEIAAALGAIHVDEHDTLLCLLPLQHVLASVINVLLPLYLGAQINFVDTLKRSELLAALEEGKISVLATVPQFFYLFHRRIEDELSRKPGAVRALFAAMLRLNRFCLRALGLNMGRLLFGRIHRLFGSRMRLFVSGGSAFDPRIAQVFHDLGFTILQGYGLTETSGACSATRVERNVIGSVGPPLPGVEIRIVDPDDAGVGEIAVRGPVVMPGYYNNPAATAEVMQDGWFLTGDLGRIDADGNLFVTGRKKEVVVLPSGKNIYPDELEAHYGQCPYIQEIAVLGIADPDRREAGERLHGVIVPNFDFLKQKQISNSREMIRDEIARWSSRLPKYKRLMSYQIQAEPLPKTTTRKIKRLELKRLIESGLLREKESDAAEYAARAPDPRQWSATGREVLACIRETYRRDKAIEPDMNLELDLGFDSMERVELLASLEQRLGVVLPEGFGAEIYTVADLVSRLEDVAGSDATGSAESRRSWSQILSADALSGEGDWKVGLSGPVFTLCKYLLARLLYLIFLLLFRMRVDGLEHLPPSGPYLVCPNHLSYLDPFAVISVLPYHSFRDTFFLGYSAFFKSRPMRLLSRLAGVVPVDPDAHLLGALRAGAWGLRQGRILCIFPEGARSFDGELQEFKKGAAILAHEIGVPIVPVGIQGTHEVLPRGRARLRFHRISVRFGPPVRPQAGDGDPYQDLTERLRRSVSDLIGRDDGIKERTG